MTWQVVQGQKWHYQGAKALARIVISLTNRQIGLLSSRATVDLEVETLSTPATTYVFHVSSNPSIDSPASKGVQM